MTTSEKHDSTIDDSDDLELDLPPSRMPSLRPSPQARVTIGVTALPLRLPPEYEHGGEEPLPFSPSIFPEYLPPELTGDVPMPRDPIALSLHPLATARASEPPQALSRPPASVGPVFGHALDLVDRAATPLTLPTAVVDEIEMMERFSLDDFSGALPIAEMILGREPTHVQAKMVRERCHQQLLLLWSSRLGGLQAIPEFVVDASRLAWLGVDHRAGFLVSHMDGQTSIEELLDISSMSALDALRILVELVDGGAVKTSAPKPGTSYPPR